MDEFLTDEQIENLSDQGKALRGLTHKLASLVTAVNRLENHAKQPGANQTAIVAWLGEVGLKMNAVVARMQAVNEGQNFTPPTPEQIKATRDATKALVIANAQAAAVEAIVDASLHIFEMTLGNDSLAT